MSTNLKRKRRIVHGLVTRYGPQSVVSASCFLKKEMNIFAFTKIIMTVKRIAILFFLIEKHS